MNSARARMTPRRLPVRAGMLLLAVGVLLSCGDPAPLAAGMPAAGVGPAAIVSPPVRVSGSSPLQPGCEGAAPAARVYQNSVVEPSLAIDPSNPEHLVGAWQQNRWAKAGSSGQVAAATWDGGRTWQTSLAAFDRCQGGTADAGLDYERISDPWVTIAPNGDVYQMTIGFDNPQDPESRNAILVSKSVDGGLTWQAPQTLIQDSTPQAFNDKGSITADPTDAGVVYAVWQREIPDLETPETPYVDSAMFARTTDGGQTWEPARPIVAVPGTAASGNLILVLPSRDLIDVFALDRLENGAAVSDLAVTQSSDHGLSWSAPTIVTRMEPIALTDPYSTFSLRPTPDNIPSAAVDRNTGQISVTWATGQFSDGKTSAIALTSSTDEGRTWTPAIQINQTPGGAPAFVPTIATLDDGSVGVSYFDLRNNTPAVPQILADHRLAYCRAGCADASNWQEAPIAGPFDLQRAPYAYGFFVGDYMGLVGQGQAFRLLYVVTTPAGDPDPTAVYFASVALK